jgi:hypothetical protein
MTRGTRLLLALLAIDAVVVWAVTAISGSSTGSVTGVVGALALAGVPWWRHRTPAVRREQELVARAMADHRDPGPAHRAAVDQRARDVLAHPRSDEWLPAALLIGLAAACVVAAVLQQDMAVALPAVPLAAAGCLVPWWYRRRLVAAFLWLDDPPYDRTTS